MVMERKLAAILSADVVGYSRLMGADEDATLEALRLHRDVIDGLIAAHRGRVFNSAGDSVVAEFPSAVEAALCASEIQREIARRNNPVPKDKRLLLRIGINIGDVAAAGLPELPFGYDGKSPDRLTAEEIKALTFGHTLRAKNIRSGASSTDVIADDGTIQTSGEFGEENGTLLYLGNSLICYRWTGWRPNCAAIFRSGSKGVGPAEAFTLVDAWGEYRYSIE